MTRQIFNEYVEQNDFQFEQKSQNIDWDSMARK